MNNTIKCINLKYILVGIIVISILLWWAVLYLNDIKIAFEWKTFKYLSTVLTIDMILFTIFAKWVWKWRILQGWLILFPNLDGIWKGRVNSLCNDPEVHGETRLIDGVLVIRQTFLNINCRLTTKESESVSYSASFLIHPESNKKQLVYSYFNKSRRSIREQSVPHDGTALLNIITEGDKIRLEGEYWTSRKTVGELAFEKGSS